MEGLYSVLSPFAIFDNIVNGLRRKIDVARILTEDVRGIMAEEARRADLAASMKDLRGSLERGTSRRVSRHLKSKTT
jgi:translin